MANTTDTRLDDLPADFVAFNQGPVAERVAAAMMGLSGGFVLLRLGARAIRKARLGLDDWIILAALWTFISEIMYGATITAVKLSILAMYDRLFPTKFMRRAVVSLAVVAMLWYFAVILVVIFQCDPIPRSWGATTEGHCIDHYSYYTGLAIPHIFIDIIILSLPIREVRRLQIVNWQKAAVCGMFLLGGFVTVISIIRLKFVAEMINVDPRSDGTMVVSTAIWSAVEVGVAIMCACLPTLQPLVRMASAYIVRKTQQSSSSTTNNAPGRSAFPPAGPDSRGSRGWTGDSSRPLNHADSDWSFKYAQDDLELGRLSREHPAFRNSFPMGLNIMPSAVAARAGRRSAGPLSLGPIRAERPLSLGLQGIMRKSYM
ncbi:integral membrane protein [Apiospora hydei]|uniref:Integral membrane protein n=1 Tax=Apiospora hydei TaxID=1337664 RepID=A0ABR1X2E4_9PEZI